METKLLQVLLLPPTLTIPNRKRLMHDSENSNLCFVKFFILFYLTFQIRYTRGHAYASPEEYFDTFSIKCPDCTQRYLTENSWLSHYTNSCWKQRFAFVCWYCTRPFHMENECEKHEKIHRLAKHTLPAALLKM